MAKNSVADWDTTAANNTDIGGISIAENATEVSDFNDAIREMMAQIKTGVPVVSSANTFTADQTFSSTDAGAIGPTLTLLHNSASPAVSDVMGRVHFSGKDSAGNTDIYARVYATPSSVTSGAEAASLNVQVVSSGSLATVLSVKPTGLDIEAADILLGTSAVAPIVVGDLGTSNSNNSQILVSRNVDDALSTSEHAFSDSSNVTGGNASMGYNSFDARIDYTGTASFDHYAGFQCSITYNSSGTLADLYCFKASPDIDAGTITNAHGLYVFNTTGAGTVTTQYGVYVASLTKGGTNWAVYTDGSTPSHFGGPIEVGGGAQIGVLDQGSWTPTLSNVANAGSLMAQECHYIRVGSYVYCFGAFVVSPTAAADTTTQIGMTLPVASNFAASTDLRGATGAAVNAQRGGVISADTTNDRAQVQFQAETTGATGFSFTFGYKVI